MNKIFEIRANTCGYDEFSSLMVVVDEKDKIIDYLENDEFEGIGWFKKHQYPLTILKIGTTDEEYDKPTIIHGDFNAG